MFEERDHWAARQLILLLPSPAVISVSKNKENAFLITRFVIPSQNFPDSPVNVAVERLSLRATLGTFSFEETALTMGNVN